MVVVGPGTKGARFGKKTTFSPGLFSFARKEVSFSGKGAGGRGGRGVPFEMSHSTEYFWAWSLQRPFSNLSLAPLFSHATEHDGRSGGAVA